uniref:Uncharacterized protein n=1 Tax=Nicotiana tabacum TaxID=4097 RepID=A0A1S4AMX8_TOBAC|nr:PREDICTED: uncharacterized protein LOC107799228 [Nicotiana tabacum]
MYQAWIKGHPPPSFPTNYTENPASIPPLSQPQMPNTIDLFPQHAPGFTPYHNYPATTQAIQSGTGGLLGKKKKEDIAMVVSESWHGQRARPSQYLVHHAQSYAQPPPYPQWRAPAPQNIYPAPQNTYPPPQPYQNPTGSNFRSRPEYRRERQQRKQTFTPLGESYASLFQWLRQLDVLRPIESKIPNPPPKNLDYFLKCAYCSDAPGHDIEKCWRLKTEIQELIDTNQIVVQSPDMPNINQNPLSAHAETHMIEIVHKDGEPRKSSKSVMMIWASESNSVKAPDSTKAKPLIVEGVTEKPSSLNLKPPVLVVKGLSKDVRASPESSKVVVPWIRSKPVIVMKGAPATPIIIKLVGQLPVIDGKIFKANMISFSDDELPMEGTEHNRALYLMVKCEDSVVSRVFVDNGSSANICPLSTLQKLNIGTKRIHLNSVCVRGFDGGGKDSVGDIMLELPWIHAAKVVPSSLHQMVKFEWDRQEIVVHGDEDLLACNDTIVPFIEAEDDKGP